jgi:hypothetical protein
MYQTSSMFLQLFRQKILGSFWQHLDNPLSRDTYDSASLSSACQPDFSYQSHTASHKNWGSRQSQGLFPEVS